MAVGFESEEMHLRRLREAAHLIRIRFSWTKHDKSGEGGTRRMAEEMVVLTMA
jgi:hypothetical protein